MKKAIYAALMHVASNKDNYHWAHCPPGGDSCCTYQRDIVNKTTLMFVEMVCQMML